MWVFPYDTAWKVYATRPETRVFSKRSHGGPGSGLVLGPEFLVVLADNLTDVDPKDMPAFHRDRIRVNCLHPELVSGPWAILKGNSPCRPVLDYLTMLNL